MLSPGTTPGPAASSPDHEDIRGPSALTTPLPSGRRRSDPFRGGYHGTWLTPSARRYRIHSLPAESVLPVDDEFTRTERNRTTNSGTIRSASFISAAFPGRTPYGGYRDEHIVIRRISAWNAVYVALVQISPSRRVPHLDQDRAWYRRNMPSAVLPSTSFGVRDGLERR